MAELLCLFNKKLRYREEHSASVVLELAYTTSLGRKSVDVYSTTYT